jgi:Fur family ferric uptake transcriptional regulator
VRDAGAKGLRRLTADDIGLRRTRQRAAILGALGNCADFVSARELHRVLTSAGETIGLTTVYRALHDLERAELVDVVRDEPGARYYRQRPAAGHRHYLICRRCGLSRPVDAEIVERWAEEIAGNSGFSDVGHTLELSGICPDCLVHRSIVR